MTWKGKRLLTYGDIARAMYAVESAEEAQQFMTAYDLENKHAAENIGYMIGYIADPAERQRLYRLFKTVHPILGGAV